MRGRHPAIGGARLRIVGFPLVVLAIIALSEASIEPARYPAVTGEQRIASASAIGAIQRSAPIELTTTAVGLSWRDEGSGDAAIRVGSNGEDWGPWIPVHADDHGPDPHTDEASGQTASEAVYTGGATWLQVQWEGNAAPDVHFVDTTGSTLGLWDRVTSQLERIGWTQDAQVLAQPDRPDILPRSSWGGQDCVDEDVSYSTRTRAEVLFVHHTIHSANANAYSPEQVPDLLYAICSYHVGVRGWNDIGYNTLIDASGRIWEGRGGGVDLPVRGAHAAGFNSTSVGVAFIGDHNIAPPTVAAQDAFVAYGAWRLDVAHIDPFSVPVVVSRDSPTYPDGVAVPLRAISGHRDVGTTGCPGNVGYDMIGVLTQRIAQIGGERIYGGWPDVDPVPGNRIEGYAPPSFDFSITSPSEWRFELRTKGGEVILEEEGTGSGGTITWAPDASADAGTYVASVSAAPISDVQAPRPTSFEFVLGDFTPPFFDDEESPHEASIDRVYELGITTGCDELRFCPLGSVERWQMALFITRLWAAAGMEPISPPEPLFVDILEYPEPTRAAIEQLAALGITNGVGPGLFEPDGVVSRWEMALFLDRTVAALGIESNQEPGPVFGDMAGSPEEVIGAVQRLAALGVTTGTSPSTFDPNGTVTREQMATFLARVAASIPFESASS